MSSVEIMWSVFQAFLLFHIAVADPILDVHPKVIDLGLSHDFETNCSFSTISTPNMAALISLTLLRANDSGPNYSELAVVTEYSDHVNLQISENATAFGLISPGGESYLCLNWKYPSEIQSGYYMCSAKGFDFTGHIIEETAVVQVTWNRPDTQVLTDKIAEMDSYIKDLENRVSQLEGYTKSLERNMSQMEDNTKLLELKLEQLEIMMAAFIDDRLSAEFMSPLTYMHRKYYLSNVTTKSDHDAGVVCKQLGGYLAEIDSANENNALQAYLNTSTGFPYVLVAGTDAAQEGTWLFQSNQQPLPYVNWEPDDPHDGNSQNCLCLARSSGWKMIDCFCNGDYNYRFLCEVPQL